MEIKLLLPSVRHDLNLYLGIFTPCDSSCLLQLFSIQNEESRGNRSTENHVVFALNIPSKFYFNHSSASWVVWEIIIAWENTKYSHVLIYSPTSLQKLTVEVTQWTPPKIVCFPIKRKETREPGSGKRGRTVLLSTSNSRTSSLCIKVLCHPIASIGFEYKLTSW